MINYTNIGDAWGVQKKNLIMLLKNQKQLIMK